jgi:hypothetical protein
VCGERRTLSGVSFFLRQCLLLMDDDDVLWRREIRVAAHVCDHLIMRDEDYSFIYN